MTIDFFDVEALPTIHQGQFDNLKYENHDTRVWLTRATFEDGRKAVETMTVERKVNGCWVVEQVSGGTIRLEGIAANDPLRKL